VGTAINIIKANAEVCLQQAANSQRRERTGTTTIKKQVSEIQSMSTSNTRRRPEPTEQEIRRSRRANRELKRGQIRARLKEIPPLFMYARYGGLSPALRKMLDSRRPMQGLFLWGLPGAGKSFVACAVARDLVMRAKAVTVKRIGYDWLMMEIRACYRDGAKRSDAQVVRDYMSPDLLIVEDVGVTTSIGQQETDFSLRMFYLFLDWRLEHMKPTIITSNKSVPNIATSFDKRIGSRLSTYRIIEIKGKDKRKE